MKKMLFLLLMMLQYSSLLAQWGGGEKYPDLKTHPESIQKWQDKKFGLFVHWGPVSLRGTEIGWSRGREVPIAEYDNLYKEFNPALFDAKKWVNMIKAAGMKYIVITSKHHDGFCIWDSEFTDYDIMSTPFKRDILKELSDECRRQGIMFGTYFSIADWHHPHYTTRYGGDPRPVEESDMNLYVDYLKKQVKELIEKYDTDIFWFDGEWEEAWSHEKGMDLYKYVRELKNDILINNRVDKGRKGMQGMTKSLKFAGDFGTPEQEIGAFHPNIPWESCITICRQWAWKPNDTMKSLKECIQTLVRTVGGGGNLLLNVGPMPDGRVEQRQIDRLTEMGSWLEKNGESIYGTKGGPFKQVNWMVSTHKDNRIYVHLFGWPDGRLVLPGLKKIIIQSVKFLNGKMLKFEQNKKDVIIHLPEEPIDKINTVLVLELNRDAASIKPLDVLENKFSGLRIPQINFKSRISPKYTPSDSPLSLVDNIRGTSYYKDGKWHGFEEETFEVELQLDGIKILDKVGVGCLQNQNSWIFFPESVEIFVSQDGQKFTAAGKIETESPANNSTVLVKDFVVDLKGIKAAHLKIKAKNIGICPVWHKGAGGKAWLFIDEIIMK